MRRPVDPNHPGYLKVFDGGSEPRPAGAPADAAEFAALSDAWQQVTGWRLAFSGDSRVAGRAVWSWPRPTDPGGQRGYLILQPANLADAIEAVPPGVAHLAQSLGGILNSLEATRAALREREAELATAIPVSRSPRSVSALARRLEATLRGGATAVGCQAAAVYLLNDATTDLQLRASWGLPRDRHLAPPRPLDRALADLEALLGHAIVLDDTSLLPQWNSPEPFASAVCVPLSSSTQLLGTVWFFGERIRDYSPSETNIMEIVAGRIVAELECEVVWREQQRVRKLRSPVLDASTWHEQQLPLGGLLRPGWDVDGALPQQEWGRRAFYDWWLLSDDTLALALGHVEGEGLEATLNLAACHTAMRSHGAHVRDASRLLRAVADTLWSSSLGDRTPSLFSGLIQPSGDRVRFALTSPMVALLARRKGLEYLVGTPLEMAEEAGRCRTQTRRLAEGERMAICSLPGADGGQPSPELLEQAHLAELLNPGRTVPAGDVARELLERLQQLETQECDGVLVIARPAAKKS